jgi:hypothetical protein
MPASNDHCFEIERGVGGPRAIPRAAANTWSGPSVVASVGADRLGEVDLDTREGTGYHLDPSDAVGPKSQPATTLNTEHGNPIMTRIIFCLSLAVVGAIVSSDAPLFGQEAPWVSLFNGTDFEGWKIVALADPAPAVVEDESMVLKQRIKTSEHTFVASQRKYRDFILELDLKDDPRFNSGILLRCVDAPADAKVRLYGYQVKIDNTPRAWTGGVFDDFGAGWTWMFDLADDPDARAAFKLGEWAHFRIECLGTTIKVWVNDVPTCHLIDQKYTEGYLAFKIHSLGNNPQATKHAIRLKNIRIITDQPERYAKPMQLAARPARTTPSSFDKPLPTESDGFHEKRESN